MAAQLGLKHLVAHGEVRLCVRSTRRARSITSELRASWPIGSGSVTSAEKASCSTRAAAPVASAAAPSQRRSHASRAPARAAMASACAACARVPPFAAPAMRPMAMRSASSRRPRCTSASAQIRSSAKRIGGSRPGMARPSATRRSTTSGRVPVASAMPARRATIWARCQPDFSASSSRSARIAVDLAARTTETAPFEATREAR